MRHWTPRACAWWPMLPPSCSRNLREPSRWKVPWTRRFSLGNELTMQVFSFLRLIAGSGIAGSGIAGSGIPMTDLFVCFVCTGLSMLSSHLFMLHAYPCFYILVNHVYIYIYMYMYLYIYIFMYELYMYTESCVKIYLYIRTTWWT